MDDFGKSFCVVMYSIVTVIMRKKNRIETSIDNAVADPGGGGGGAGGFGCLSTPT